MWIYEYKKWLSSYKFFFLAIIFLCTSVICDILFSLQLSNLLDYLMSSDRIMFQYTIVLMLIFMSLSPVIRYIGDYCTSKFVEYNLYTQKNIAFSNDLNEKNIEYDLSQYTTFIDVLEQNYYTNIVKCSVYAIELAITSLTLFKIHKAIFWYLLFSTVISFNISKWNRSKLSKTIEIYTEYSKDYLQFLDNSLKGKKDIHQCRSYDVFLRKHSTINKILEQSRSYVRNNKSYLMNVNDLVTSLNFWGLMFLSGNLVIRGKIRTSAIITIIQLMNYFISPLIQLTALYSQILSVKPDKKNETNTRAVDTYTNKNWKSLKLQNLQYEYSGVERIRFPDIEIEKGKKYVIQAKSGSGKSTLGKIICGDLEPTSGYIYIDNKIVTASSLRDMCFYMQQDTHLFYDSIENNISMYRNTQSLGQLLTFCNLNDNIDVSKKITPETSVSGGERNRIGIARSIYEKKEIIILDEPTANLDKKNSEEILNKLFNISDSTIIVITHDNLDDIKNIDRVIHL